MQTRQALVLRALLNVGGVAAGQAAAPEDYKVADDAVEPTLASLASRGMWQWGDPDQIDDDTFLILADLLANEIALDFGKPKDEGLRMVGEQHLHQLQPVILSGERQQTEYF